jgi:Uncharacterized protein conserved in bacteria
MEEVKKIQRVAYFDALRVISAIAVIAIHVASLKWDVLNVGSSAWNVASFLNAAMRFAVPVFVMISGALLLDPEKEFSTRKFYRKNIARIAIAFAAWSAIYVVYSWLVKGWHPSSFWDVVALFIKGHYHMWFLYMLLGLYLITPILRFIARRRKMMVYFLVLGLIFSFILPGIGQLAGAIATVHGDAAAAGVRDVINSVLGSVRFSFASGFVVYYMLGYYLRSTYLSRAKRIVIYVLGIMGLMMAVLLTHNASMALGVNTGFFSENTPWYLALSVAVFVLFKYHGDRIGNWRAVRTLAATSFGIYLIHAMVLDLLLRVDYIQTSELNLAAYLVVIAATFAISFVAVWVMRKIPLIRKIV